MKNNVLIIKNDNELFELAAQGNKDAFEVLYKRLFPPLYVYARKFVDNPDAAQDLVQDAFIQLLKNKKTMDIQHSVSAYLYKIVHHFCLNLLRNQRSHAAHHLLILQELDFYAPDKGHSSIFMLDIESILRKSVEGLPPQQRQLFKLSRFHHISNIDIATLMNLSVRTVENQLYRALKQLKNDLKDYL